MIRVLGFGDNVVDKYEHKRIMFPGGNCVNFAVFAKQCGAESAYMGIFGTDAEAECVIKALSGLGIEIYKCRQREGENGCARVTIKNGDRVFLGSNKGGIRRSAPYRLDRFDIEYIKSFDLVHSGNYSYTEDELPKIRRAGVPVSFDFSHDMPLEYFEEVAPYADYSFVSCSRMGDEEIRNLLAKIIGFGSRIAVATMGPRGCAAFDGTHYIYQEAVEADAKDTMGAGDSLITAFLISYVGKLRRGGPGGGESIRQSLREASEFAIKTCMVEGSFGCGEKY